MHLPPHRQGCRQAGFSLGEIFVVIALMLIMFTMARGFIKDSLVSSTLGNEADQFVSALEEGRLRSISRSIHVEVRFYRFLDESRSDLIGRFFAWEILEMGDNGAFNSLGGPHRIPGPILISEEPRLSSLAMDSSKAAFPADENRYGEDAVYSAFRFEPNGSTDLPAWPRDRPDDHWFVTFVRDIDVPLPEGTGVEGGLPSGTSEKHGDLVVPADFVTVQVDPFTGQVRTFRP